MNYEIIHLPKEQWKDHVVPIGYTTKEYFHVEVERKEAGFTINIEKKELDQPVAHTPEASNFSDKLYAQWWQDACCWGVLVNGRLVAAIETDPEKWSNRLRVTELWVDENYQKQGIGHALMEVAKEQAELERRRAVILETQSCNVNAIEFYLHEGFTLIGMDTCCYGNHDIDKKEVRIEMGWFPKERKKLSREDVEIRMERPEDWREVEAMVQKAFWNKYKPGCDEHYLVHKLRMHQDYLPHLSRIAVKDGEIIGTIMYTRAWVQDGDTLHNILSFGPLCIKKQWQGCGIGEMLFQETMELAGKEGWPGIVIFGEPDYYPRLGFRTCHQFGITTADGKNMDAFMGIECKPGSFDKIHGKYYGSKVFEEIHPADAENYNKQFPPLKKQYFPGQWNEIIQI